VSKLGKNKQKLQVIILSAVLLIGALTIAKSVFMDHKYPLVGDKAPDFKLVGLDGNMHSLADYRGKMVLINFWGTYCAPCKDEMPDIQKQYLKWQGKNTVVLGINMGENQITAQSFIDQVKATFPVLLDESMEIRNKYGVNQYPTSFFVKPNGKIEKIKIGKMEESFIGQTFAELAAK
jgi:peroxiredoxin